MEISQRRMTSVFKDCCRLLSCLLVFAGLVSAWACLRVIGGPAGAVMGMTASLSQRTPGDTHLLHPLSFCTVFTEQWERQVLQPVWGVWKQKTTADRDAVPHSSIHAEVWDDTNTLIFLPYTSLWYYWCCCHIQTVGADGGEQVIIGGTLLPLSIRSIIVYSICRAV